MATMVGLVTGATTGKVYAVINPDEDAQLDNPRYLLIQIEEAQREPLTMVKVPLAEYMGLKAPADLQRTARTRIGIKAED